jgi:hypothetical protein
MQQTIDENDFKSSIDMKKLNKKKPQRPKNTVAVEGDFGDQIESVWKRITRFIFGTILTKKSAQENIFQYIARQFLLTDSNGKPSITTTMTWLTVVMTYFWFKFETMLAFKEVTTTTAEGVKTVTVRGYNDYVYAILMLILSAVLAMYYKRSKKTEADAASETGIIETAKTFIAAKFGVK